VFILEAIDVLTATIVVLVYLLFAARVVDRSKENELALWKDAYKKCHGDFLKLEVTKQPEVKHHPN